MAGLALGDRRKLARAISCVENRSEGYETLLREAYANSAWPTVVGVTGPPGAGKSTLVDRLSAHYAAAGGAVAVLAIDPSSPFSGGAVLGDRIRMDRSQGFENVYFRSLSARGHLGGASSAACDLIAVLAHHGFEHVILETVGAGQSDIEVTGLVDCTLVLAVPGLGDAVQALKAGIMEIGDIYVINKSDLPGAAVTGRQIESTLALAYPGKPGVSGKIAGDPPFVTLGRQALMRRHGNPFEDATFWHPPVLPVTAAKEEGIADLVQATGSFLTWAAETGRLAAKRRIRLKDQILRGLSEHLLAAYGLPYSDEETVPPQFKAVLDRVSDRSLAPLDAVMELVAERGEQVELNNTVLAALSGRKSKRAKFQ